MNDLRIVYNKAPDKIFESLQRKHVLYVTSFTCFLVGS